MINWIVIDDVTYQWDGNLIRCNTEVGYSLHISGNKLENIDVTDKDNNVCGHLSVDFSTNAISYVSSGELFDDELITYSLNGVQKEVFLSEVFKVDSQINESVDFIESNQDELWYEISNHSHIHLNNINSNFSIDCSQLLEAKDLDLDLALNAIDGNKINNAHELNYYHDFIDVELMYIQSEVDVQLIQNINEII
nr:hypothetical protein [uncultured Tolumonas sp.]